MGWEEALSPHDYTRVDDVTASRAHPIIKIHGSRVRMRDLKVRVRVWQAIHWTRSPINPIIPITLNPITL